VINLKKESKPLTLEESIADLAKKAKKSFRDYFKDILDSIHAQQFATHIGKATETNCEHLVLYNNTTDNDSNYLCTASCGNTGFADIACDNANKSRAQSFLFLEHNNKTNYQRILEDDIELRSVLEKHIDNYNEIRKAVMSITKASVPTFTNHLIKQVYFPIAQNNYHILSILPSSVLLNQVSGCLFSNRKVKKINTANLTSNAASTTGSRLIKKNFRPTLFYSVPPYFLKKSLQKSLQTIYLLPDFSIDEINGFRKGMLVDKNMVGLIVQEGIRKGRGHYLIESKRDERKEETTRAFLKKYNYDSTPLDFEIHHIVPIAQSGADDIRNMVLLPKDIHQHITQVHREVFLWKRD